MKYYLLTLLLLAGCQNSLAVLEGSTHACGTIHVEGYLTDSQGELVVVKAPNHWTPEQVMAFCQQD